MSHKILKTHHKINKLIKSPFLIGLASGVGAIVFDIIWLTGELSTHFGFISPKVYLILRIIILLGLISALILAGVATYKYLENGYVRHEHHLEAKFKKDCKHKKR